MIDVRGKRFCVFGLQGSGKSSLAKSLLRSEPAHLVFDPMDEYDGFNRYVPETRSFSEESNAEVDLVIRKAVVGSGRVRLFLVDEASRFFPARRPLPGAMAELNDLHRHYGVGFGLVARRPVQLHTDLVELAHVLFVFRLVGVNDLAYLRSVASGLDDAVAGLGAYEFVVVDALRQFSVHRPVAV